MLTRTTPGRMVRAAALDREMLGALGANVGWLYTGMFALASFLAGLSGALITPIQSIVPGRMRPGRGDARQAQRQRDAADQREPSRTTSRAHRRHDQAAVIGGRRRIRRRIPPIPPTMNVRPTIARTTSRVAAGTTVAPGRSRPAMTRDGAAAPRASMARSNPSWAGARRSRSWSATPDDGIQLHPAIRAQVVEEGLGRRRAVLEREAVVAGRYGQQGGRRSVSR